MASRESYRAIARRLAVSPDTVSRYARQLVEAECQAAGLPAVLSSCEPYRCGGCDRMVATRPCVACTATGAPRHG